MTRKCVSGSYSRKCVTGFAKSSKAISLDSIFTGPIGGFTDKRYDGYLAGGGLTYGYDWILSPHWNLEAAVGVGYARLWYKESDRIPCLKCYENKTADYIGLTKLAVTFVYIF